MKFLYATDLHGAQYKYEALFNFALKNDIFLIHIGSDLLPKDSNIFEIQKYFIINYLKGFYQKCKDNGIDVIGFFGNDDIYTRKKYFKKFGSLLDETPFKKEGYEFKAYPYVQDYPFGLKSACKWDSSDWRCPEKYIHKPRDVGEKGWVDILDPIKYFTDKGTIEEDLKNTHASNKTVMAIHQPPWALGLDVCLGGRRVGSKAIYDWIEREQPLICLCGHIHESYSVTKIWKAKVGSTLVIQPGQDEEKTRCVFIEIQGNEVNSEILNF